MLMTVAEPRSTSTETLLVQNLSHSRWRSGPGSLDALAEEWPEGAERAVVVADQKAWRSWGPEVMGALSRVISPPDVIGVASGERSKQPAVYIRLVQALLRAGADRTSVVVAVGGGVTTDLAGFAAGTCLRGLRLINVPTTLVGQVDAALGGKTAVDLPEGKNLVGMFHWPVVVVSDPRFLDTLPRRHVRNGLAEMVKSALIADPDLLDVLDRDARRLAAGRPPAPDTVHRAALVKWGILGVDPFEQGPRHVLNLGHTAGHAIEAASGLRVTHGEAVAAGLAVAARVAVHLTGFARSEADLLRQRLRRLGLPDEPQVSFDAARPFLFRDKKVRKGRVRMALPRAPGVMEPGTGDWTVPVDEDLLLECWHGLP
jgi:3-dehydroquinate synthetase